VDAKRIHRLQPARVEETVEPVDVLHAGASAAGPLGGSAVDHRDRRVGALGALIGGCHQPRVGGRIGRTAPLAGQVGLIEDLDGGECRAGVLDGVVDVVLEVVGVDLAQRAAGPVGRTEQAHAHTHAVVLGGVDDVGQVIGAGLTPLILLFEGEVAATWLRAGPGQGGGHNAEAGAVGERGVADVGEQGAVREAVAGGAGGGLVRRALIGRGRGRVRRVGGVGRRVGRLAIVLCPRRRRGRRAEQQQSE
jgi:hypothetical protein